LREVFLPTATIALPPVSVDNPPLIGPQMLADSIAASIPEAEFFEFVVLNAHVELDDGGEQAHGRMYVCAFRSSGETLGVYHDRYRRISDRWWIESRRYDPLARTETPRSIVQLPHLLILDD
jgi:hypothetical protein